MQKSQMTVGQDYAVSVYYGRYDLGSDHGLTRARLLRFEKGEAVFDVRHEVSGRSRKWDAKSVGVAKVAGTWAQHLEAKAAKDQEQVDKVARLQAEADKRNAALAFLDKTLPDWDTKETAGAFVDESRYENQVSLSPREYYSQERKQVTLHNDKSGVDGGEAKVTVVLLASLVQAAYDAGYLAAQLNFDTGA